MRWFVALGAPGPSASLLRSARIRCGARLTRFARTSWTFLEDDADPTRIRAKMRLRLIALAAALLSAPTGLQSQDAADANLALGRQVAARYDSAFSALVTAARQDTAKYRWILELADFKAERIGWGVELNGSLRAVTTVRREAYLVVVPSDDPAYARMGSIMETDPGATLRATRVKADTIAGAWAAIFLAFELSHLRDDILGLLPEDATSAQFAASSRRAYGAEYLAALALGGGATEQFLDSVLTAVGPESLRSLAEGARAILRQSFDRFDAHIATQKALTEREEQRRAGVYAVSLLLRYAETRDVSDLEFAGALRCVGGCK